MADAAPIELTVYEPRELRSRPRSSTDGKPIVRMGIGAVEALCAREHAEAWRHYLETGEVEGMEALLTAEEEPMPGRFDGLLEGEDGGEEERWPEPGEEEEPEQEYDPLPGFEGW